MQIREYSRRISRPVLNAGNYTEHMRLWPTLICLLPLLSSAKLRADETGGANAARAANTVALSGQPVALSESATPIETSAPAAIDSQVESGTRLTLTLDDAPLLQVLHLLGSTGAARFRLGALPDSVVSVRWKDEDPFASLDELARRAGWCFQRDEADYFLLPSTNSTSAAGSWVQWTSVGAPPRSALIGPDESMRVKLKGKLAETPATSPVAAEPKSNSHDAKMWRTLLPAVDASRAPGLLVQSVLPRAAGAAATASAASGPVWLRTVVPLAMVPHGARLLLESAAACDVLVNGAPLARHWSGLRAFDLDPLLRRGTNVIIVRWPAVPAPPAGSPPRIGPALRYEWIFEGGTSGAGLPGENRRERG